MKIIETVKQILEELQATSGKTEKEHIIRQNSHMESFRQTLGFILNPYITTGLSDKKINKVVSVQPNISLKSPKEAMDYLKHNNTGTDKIISVVQDFISRQPEDMREFYKSIFTKSIKLGCAANTVNKVLGKGFIPQFEVQLAEKYFEHPDKVESKEFTLTLKVDGIRAIILKDGNSVSIFSRQGQPIEGLVDIEAELLAHTSKKFVLDGELLISDTTDIPSKEQYKATTKIVRRDGEKHGITFRAFDFLHISEFQNQKCLMSYQLRRDVLETVFKDGKYIRVLPTLYSGNDTSQILKWLGRVRADGQEGLMININDAPYEFKRTQNLLKVKIMQDADLRITNIYEGTGRNVGKLGGIEVEFKHEGKHYRCNCGSGFTDEERGLYFNQPKLLLDKMATIQYFEISRNEKGEYGLRFPVWTGRIREEKTEISMH